MCRNGHPETDNSRYPYGNRECRKCVVNRQMAYRARLAAKAAKYDAEHPEAG